MRRILATVAVGAVLATGMAPPALAAPQPVGPISAKPEVKSPREGTAAPGSVRGLNQRLASGDKFQSAKDFLGRDVSTFKVAPGDLKAVGEVKDGDTSTLVFEQTHKGIPVLGGRYMVHLSGSTITGASGNYQTGLSVKTQAAMSVSRAKVFALAQLDSRLRIGAQAKDNGLVVLPRGRGVLARHFSISGQDEQRNVPVRREIYLEANTGAPLLNYNNLQADSADVRGTGTRANGNKVTLDLRKQGTGFAFVDRQSADGKGSEIRTYDAKGFDSRMIGPGTPPDPIKVATTKSSTVTGDLSKRGVVDAHWGAGVVQDYYRSNFGRNGLDGKGSPMLSVADATDGGGPMDNAYWDGTKMVYGNGSKATYPFSAAVDVVGHEMTHGVIEHTAKLMYINQSGAMNEAIADYFGNAIEVNQEKAKMTSKDAGLLGEDLCRAGTPRECAIRDLNDGRRADRDYIGATTNTDEGGVHLNSTIFSGALWDLREKLPPAVADKLVYKALTEYMTPLDTFSDGRTAVQSAAEAMKLNADQQRAVTKAFDDHGIYPGWEAAIKTDTRLLRSDVLASGGATNRNGWWVATDQNESDGSPYAVYAGRVDGGRTYQVSPNDGRWHMNATTDGKSVWWVAYGESQVSILRRNLTGGKVETLYTTPLPIQSVTTDGTSLAWTESDYKANPKVWYLHKGNIVNADPFNGTISLDPVLRRGILAFASIGSDRLGKGTRIRSVDLETGKMRDHAFLKDAPQRRVAVGTVVLTRNDVVWSQDARDDAGEVAIMRAGITGGRPVPLIGETDADAPLWPTLTANEDWVTYSSLGQAQDYQNKNLSKLYQMRADGTGSVVRVSCNRGGQTGPTAGRDREVMWLDGTVGTTDLVTRRTPAGQCKE